MDQSSQPQLITDIINNNVDLVPNCFMSVSKALNARAYAALEAPTSNFKVGEGWWHFRRYYRFANCVSDDVFARLVPKFTLKIYDNIVIAAEYLYTHCLYSKLVLLADYHRKLSSLPDAPNWSLITLAPTHVATYLRIYGLSQVEIVIIDGKTHIALTKWSSTLGVAKFHYALSLTQLRDLYATRPDIAMLKELHNPAHLICFEPEALALIIKLSRRCPVNVLVSALSKRQVGVIAEIANPEVVLRHNHEDVNAMRSEQAYIFTYAAEAFAEPLALASIRDRLRAIATAPQFTQITFAFEQYHAADNSMPEIQNHRRENLLTVALGPNNMLFPALFAWCCYTEDRTLITRMVNLGAAREPQFETYNTSPMYWLTIQRMVASDYPYGHTSVAGMILAYMQYNEISFEATAFIMQYAKRIQNCACPSAGILLNAIAMSMPMSRQNPEVYIKLRQKLHGGLVEGVFGATILQAIINSIMNNNDDDDSMDE